MTQHLHSAERGRPREFDMDSALDKAMVLFREKGFQAAAISELGQVMGLTVGSIYKACGDKNRLFAAVFARYLAQRHAALKDSIAGKTNGLEKIAALIDFYLDSAQEVEGRRGCLVVGSTVQLQVFAPMLVAQVEQAVSSQQGYLAALIAEGQADGSISSEIDGETATSLLQSLLYGLRVAGKVANPGDHQRTIAMALKILQ